MNEKVETNNLYDINTKKRIISILVLNFFVMSFFVLVGPKYETNDDIGIKLLAMGLYSEPTKYLIFVNTIIGSFISALYRFSPFISWYDIFCLLIIYASLCVISWLIEKRLTGKIGLILKYLFLIIYGFDLYCNIQFTKTAAVSSVAGSIIILDLFNDIICVKAVDRRSRIYRGIKAFFGAILFLTGSMIRFGSFKMVIPFFLLTVIYLLLNNAKNIRKQIAVGIVFTSLVLVALSFIINKYDSKQYFRDAEWNNYKSWYSAVAKCVDRDIPEYWETGYYEEAGINAHDFYTLKGWYYGDPDFFDPELLKTISNAEIQEKTVDWEYICSLLKIISENIIKLQTFWVVILFLVIYILFSKKNFYSNITYALTLTAISILVVYCAYRDKLHNRALVSIFLAGLMVLIFITDVVKKEMKRKGFFVPLLVISAFLLVNTNEYYSRFQNIKEKSLKRTALQERAISITENKDILFVNDIDNNLFETAWGGVFSTLPEGMRFDNVVDIAGWLCNTPMWNDTLKRHGITNIYKDACDNNVIYISNDNRISSIVDHINRHYNESAKAQIIQEFDDGMKLYKIVSE